MNAVHEARHANRRAWLRNHTQALHTRLDSSPPLRALLQPGLTSLAYRDIMAAMYTAHAQLEPALLALDGARPPALSAYASRLTLITLEIARHHDGQASMPLVHVDATQEPTSIRGSTSTLASASTSSLLSALTPAHTYASAAGKHTVTDTATPAQLQSRYLGLRYVLEGATQGSRFIQRSLQQHNPGLHIGPDSYWATLATNSTAWSCLCDIIDDKNHAIDDTELLAGATLGFNTFINTFYNAAT